MCISTSSSVAGTEGYEQVAAAAYVFHDHSITTDHCYTLRVLSTPNNALCMTGTNNTAGMLHHFVVMYMSKTKPLRPHVYDLFFNMESCHGKLAREFRLTPHVWGYGYLCVLQDYMCKVINTP
jgi:hypothetical protein